MSDINVDKIVAAVLPKLRPIIFEAMQATAREAEDAVRQQILSAVTNGNGATRVRKTTVKANGKNVVAKANGASKTDKPKRTVSEAVRKKLAMNLTKARDRKAAKAKETRRDGAKAAGLTLKQYDEAQAIAAVKFAKAAKVAGMTVAQFRKAKAAGATAKPRKAQKANGTKTAQKSAANKARSKAMKASWAEKKAAGGNKKAAKRTKA